MKFQATFEVNPDDGEDSEDLAVNVENEAGDALMDLGYSNIDVKAV